MPADNTPNLPQLEGSSLSTCIKDILDGHVTEEQVVRIVTGTDADHPITFMQVLTENVRRDWNGRREGIEIGLRLREAGKIDQPRTRGEPAPPTHHIHWRNVKTKEPVIFNSNFNSNRGADARKILPPGRSTAFPQHAAMLIA